MLIVVIAFVIGALSAALCISQAVEPERLRELIHRLRHPRFTIRQMMTAIAVVALVLLAIGAGHGEERVLAVWLLVLCALFWFARTWQREFVFLMGLRDDDFPGRRDKLVWVAIVLLMAPIGVWLFRAYRLAHWPEPASDDGLVGEAKVATAQPV
jgi:drug/metabolite transporter (DMT)-like permease